jgi:hypothetical protein
MISNQHPTALMALGEKNHGERGAALLTALLVMVLIAGISMCVLATVSNEVRIAGSDLQRTQSFYAAAAGVEKMASDFSALFTRTARPTQSQLNAVAAAYPPELLNEGFSFTQTLFPDDATLAEMRAAQGIVNGAYPTVTIPTGPFAGLLASIAPYKATSTVTQNATGAQVRLEREMNNYLIPLFQFGMFSDRDIELHPGPPFVFNGRIHANGNIYINGDVTLRDKVTVANELVYDVLRNDSTRAGANVRMMVNGITVPLNMGSVVDGPNFPSASAGQRGFFPGSPDGSDNANWKSTSVAAAQAGRANRFGGQLLTRLTGAAPLLLPLQTGGNQTFELIKRSIAGEAAANPILNQSRYHSKSQIRILLDDENAPADAAGIPAGQGIRITADSFNPSTLDGGMALIPVNDNGVYTSAINWIQGNPAAVPRRVAQTVRGIRDYNVPANAANPNYADINAAGYAAVPKSPGGGVIPPGSGINAKILIQIVAPDGTTRDVTREILSMGVTEGEPNGIVYLQRPLWAAYMQGSRDRDGGRENLTFLTTDATSRCIADGEINPANFSVDANAGFYNTAANNVDDDLHTVLAPYMPVDLNNFIRNDRFDTAGATRWNQIVPISVYNPREGWIAAPLDENQVFESGMTSVVEINMRNLARWVDGVYDTNLLAGTPAVAANINGADGYILYVSDRRGDRVKNEGGNVMSNGKVDNEDIYGQNGTDGAVCSASRDQNGCERGEDSDNNGTLARDLLELQYTNAVPGTGTATNAAARRTRAETILSWRNPTNLFRRAVRLFDGDNLQVTGAADRLSTTKGITVATENMVYIWGSYNTTGIAVAPPAGTATLNDGGYLGPQVPSSIVADAFFPLSNTWSDSMSAINPEGGNAGATMRTADVNVAGPTEETSVRAGIIAGDNVSALTGNPDAGNGADSRLSGGLHNFPRFLENWLTPQRRWNFVGSFCPLYRSTQAHGPWIYLNQQIYGAPSRNWAFDTTFRNVFRLPPGTPMFQYLEQTGFRQVL